MTIKVVWDPSKQDHPVGWDWNGLVGNKIVILNFIESEENESGRKAV